MIVLLLGVLLSISWSSCIPITGSSYIDVKSKHYLCLTFNGVERSVYNVEPDKLSQYNYTGLYKRVAEKSPAYTFVELSISSLGKDDNDTLSIRSAPKLYYGSNFAKNAFSVLTAIINVEKGVAKSITWDNGCYTCQPSHCGDNTLLITNGTAIIVDRNSKYKSLAGKNCFMSEEDCKAEQANCDLQLFVVWSGTDIKGMVFQSHALRLSRFQSGSAASFVNNLV